MGNVNAAQSFAKQKMDAAYKKYMDELRSRTPNQQKLQIYKKEYDMATQEYNRVSR
jgi:hypothetical protein